MASPSPDLSGRLVEALAASPPALWAAQSAWAYPIANVIHVLGAITLVGVIGFLDLRLLGYAKAIPARALSNAVTPIGWLGFALLAGSGVVLFLADVGALVASTVYWTKLTLIAAAGANMAALRLTWPPSDERVSGRVKLMAAASLTLWLSVAVLGRMIAYT